MRTQDEAPVPGVFPMDGPLHRLEIRLQAIQLSPISRGSLGASLPTPGHDHRFTAMLLFPYIFQLRGKASDPGMYLRIPPGYTGDTTGRHVAPHALVPLTFRRQVSHQTQKPPSKFLPAER